MKRPRQTLPREIFLSHSHTDRRFADKLATTLRQHGIPVWYSRTHLRGAQQWQQEIGQALQRCDWFVVILTPNSVKSMWVKRELSYALNQKRLLNKIVPVVYRKCDFEDVHWTLGTLQMVSMTGDFTKGCSVLLKTWGRELNHA